jgi:hypothetical protein
VFPILIGLLPGIAVGAFVLASADTPVSAKKELSFRH